MEYLYIFVIKILKYNIIIINIKIKSNPIFILFCSLIKKNKI